MISIRVKTFLIFVYSLINSFINSRVVDKKKVHLWTEIKETVILYEKLKTSSDHLFLREQNRSIKQGIEGTK